MVQTYLKFLSEATIGLISSFKSNVCYLNKEAQIGCTPALENIIVWNLKKGEKVATWSDPDNTSEVSFIRPSPDGKFVASGYMDGSIRLWGVEDNSLVCVLNGHTSEVTTLQFDNLGLRLLSGSKDTNLVIWDVVNESGLYRLKGHKNQITQAQFIGDKNYIVSVSKDCLIKVWDLSTQHCVQTLPGHTGEILSLTVNQELSWVITGGVDVNLKVWQINWDILDKGVLEIDTQTEFPLTHLGDLQRPSSDKVHQLEFHPDGSLLFGLIGDKMVEVWRIRTADEIKKKLKRHLKKLKEKASKSTEDQSELEESINRAVNQPLSPSDRITSWGTIRTQARIRSFSTAIQQKPAQASILFGLTNNSVHVQTISLPDNDPKAPFEPKEQYQLELQGHRAEIRCVSLSSDDRLLASFGPGLIKVWVMETLQCIRTLECGHALCGSFLPGDRYIIVGTKSGNLQIFDLGSSTMVQDVKAHTGSIWSLHISPDNSGLVTGSGDKNVMFWNFKELTLENLGRHLQIEHVKTLQMTDDVLCVRYSPNQNLLAVSLLDATVKVFYTDSLKLFLSLYGHKLPVMTMDISSDNSLILTGSADKNVKIWGLDFGDCHKSLFAHDEAVVGVRFQPKTHYFFSCGKDNQVRYWDGDRFESIMKLNGHLGEVWGLEVSKKGRFVVSASGDRSIRVWVRTDEPLFLEEEREKEMEETYEQELIGNQGNDQNDDEEGAERAGQATIETLKSGERIIEAVEICQREWERQAEYDQLAARGQNPPPPLVEPLLNALQVKGEQYLLDTIAKVKSAELEDALLVIPLSHVVHILKCIEIWCKRRVQIPLICRITTFLIQTHHRQLVSNQLLKPVLDGVKDGLRHNLKLQKDTIGYNLMGLKHLQREYQAQQTSDFFEEADSTTMEEDKVTIKRKTFA